MATDDLEVQDGPPERPLSGSSLEATDDEPEGTEVDWRTSTPRDRDQIIDSETDDDQADDSFVYFRSSRRPLNRIDESDDDLSVRSLDASIMNEHFPRPSNWIDKDFGTLKYVDDFLAHEKLALINGYTIFSEQKQKRILHAKQCQEFFVGVKERAAKVGMKVNDNKTQLLCINAARDSDTSSYIRLPGGNKIESQQTLKILGFRFDTAPTIQAHVEHLRTSFRKRLWVIRHLFKAGLSQSDLVAMYKTFLLSLLDYACVVYHCMLNTTQAHMLEHLQKSALQIIYGHKTSYEEMIEISGLEYLHDRRARLTDNFIRKTANNERFRDDWFPRREFVHPNMRKEMCFKEKYARTERLYKAPIYYYRRRMNEMTKK